MTAGIFRRADPGCGGFQGGVAYDYLHDVYNPYGTYTQATSSKSAAKPATSSTTAMRSATTAPTG